MLEAEREAAATAAAAETLMEEAASRRKRKSSKLASTPRSRPVRHCSDSDTILQCQPLAKCASGQPPTHGGELDCIGQPQPQGPPSKNGGEAPHHQPGDSFTSPYASQHQSAATPSLPSLTRPVRHCSDSDTVLQCQPWAKCASGHPPTHGGELDCIGQHQPQGPPSKRDREAHLQLRDSSTVLSTQHPPTTIPSPAHSREKDKAPASTSASGSLSDTPAGNKGLVAVGPPTSQPGRFGYRPTETKKQSVSMIFTNRSLKISWSLKILSTARCVKLHLVGATTTFWHFTSMVWNPAICHKLPTQTPASRTHHHAPQLSAPMSTGEKPVTHQPLLPAKPATWTPAPKAQPITTPQFPPAGSMTQKPPVLQPLRGDKSRKTFEFFRTFLSIHPQFKTLQRIRAYELGVHVRRSLRDLRLLFSLLWKALRKVPL